MITRYTSNEGVYPIALKIFYGNGDVYTLHPITIEGWDNLPSNDVQIVLIFESQLDDMGKPTKVIFFGEDYYFYDGTDLGMGSGEGIPETRKFGKWTSEENITNLYKLAMEDYHYE